MNKLEKKPCVLVAMSGGVDSAISAYLLKQQGFQVNGVHFVMEQRKNDYAKEVQKIADFLGIELVVRDITNEFKKEVIDYFLEKYSQLVTPNPCVICNREIKFKKLIDLADELRVEKIATGHYAQIQEIEHFESKQYRLAKGKDPKKDQSYFLYRLTQEQLERIIFPLAKYTKDKVKELAKQINLPVSPNESQDVCFFPSDQGAREFIASRIETQPGQIVDEEGWILGQHQGLAFYTQGQRTGLGLSGGPYYVIGKDAASNELVVSLNRDHPRLISRLITIKDVNWILEEPVIGKQYIFRSRYQIKETLGRFKVQPRAGQWEVELDRPQWGVAAGQSLVAYEDERVLGGGIISDFK